MKIARCPGTRKVPSKAGNPEESVVCFSPTDAKMFVKSQEAQQKGASLLFITFNPPANLNIAGWGAQLEEYRMFEQVAWMQKVFDKFAKRIYSEFKQFDYVYEQTEAGVIHVHIIAEKRDPEMLDTDIKKLLWMFFDINLDDYKDSIKRRNAVSKHSVHVQPITDMAKVLEYLFKKDKKDYETLYNKKHNGELIYLPRIMTCIPVTHDSTDESDSSESDSDLESEYKEIVHLTLKKRASGASPSTQPP